MVKPGHWEAGCAPNLFRDNKSRPDIGLVSKVGFVIEDLSNVGNTEELLDEGLEKNEEKLTDYIFAKILIYIP